MTAGFKAGIISMLLILGTFGSVIAQDTTSADGLFASARQIAYNQKDYAGAIRFGKKALAIAPKYTDIVIFVGRVYAWDKNYDSSLTYLQRALGQNASYEDVYLAYADLEYWNSHYTEALNVIQQGLSHFSDSEPLLLRKAKVLMAAKNYKEALPVTNALLAMNENNAEARALNVLLKDLSCNNKVTVKLDNVHFDKQFPDDWRFGSVELINGTKFGAWGVRVNVANRFQTPGLQYEIDLYPRLSKRFYMYLNGGYGDHIEVFPKWRAGASLFSNLPSAFEAELGARYLYYTSNAVFFTGYVGKYYKRFLFGARTYITPETNTFSNTMGLSARYYFGGADDYISLAGSRGISVDDRRFITNLYGGGKQPSYFGELLLKKAIRKVNVISFNVSLYRYQYLPEVIGNQFQVGLGYTKRFM
jgi:YaiO family outer membrane protein